MDREHSFSGSINGSTFLVIPRTNNASSNSFEWRVASTEVPHDTERVVCNQQGIIVS